MEEPRRDRARRALPVFVAPPSPPLEPPRTRDAAFRPIIAVWEITLRCDLACRHCGSRAAVPRPAELDTAACLDLVDQLAELGVRETTLIGGEVYLRDDWTVILRALRDRGILPTIVTGGRGFGPERAAAAAAAGLHTAGVSVDGEEAAHDRLRGPGSHRAALAALANLRDAGVLVAVNTQVNRATVGDLEAVLERVAPLGARSWQLQLTVPMGRAADEPDLILQPYDLLDVFPRVGRLAVRAREIGVDLVPGNNLGYFGPYEHLLRGGMAGGHGASCGAGVLTLGIEADGTIKGCPSLATAVWSGGTVRARKLRDIWERTAPLRFARDRDAGASWGRCAGCYYEPECRGGCTWMSDSLLGRPGNNPYCHHRALELAREGLRERVERVAEAPGHPFDRARYRLIEEPIPVPGKENHA